ncbi:MAG: RNA-guided endonuclease InsQ/TnpB family protein, partial [Thiohalorhabdaceae bacterium]
LLAVAGVLRARYRMDQDADTGRVLYTERGLRNLLPEFKALYPFLNTVHSSPLKNAALRASDSIRRHQAAKHGRRRGKAVGWPRFRSWKANWFSLLFDEPGKGFKLEGIQLRLSLGHGADGQRRSVTVHAPDATKVLANKRVKNLRIVKQHGVFYAVFGVERAVPEAKPIHRAIALDPNPKNLAVGVDTDGNAITIEAPWWLKRLDRRVDELKARRDRCLKRSVRVPIRDRDGHPTGRYRWRPSKRWQRFNAAYQRAMAKRREQTKTYLATVAQKLSRHYDLIAVGDYAPQGGGINAGMRRAMTNQSVIARFKDTLSWTALKSGKAYAEFAEAGTTRTCADCGHVVEGGLAPSVRAWACPSCGRDHDRDENAARNGLRKLLRERQAKGGSVPSVPGSGPVPIRERWTWRVQPSGIQSRGGRTGDPIRERQGMKRTA